MADSINKNERIKGLGDETWSLEQVKDFKKEERLIPTFAKGVKVFLTTLNILYCIVRIEDLLLFVQLHATFKFILLQAFGFTLWASLHLEMIGTLIKTTCLYIALKIHLV